VTAIKVWPIDWGDAFLVRGTDDVEAARHAVFEHLHKQGDHTPDEAADRIYRLRPEVGWYRTNPCICGDEHRFDMATADGPGRGTFRGIYLEGGR
jgi:hypothetical protein